MSTRLLLEGDDLETLLTRVRAEYGPDATVVRAERVRTGGIGGFFAHERFELTIEVPERQPLGLRGRSSRLGGGESRLGAPRESAATGIDALLAAADAAERDDFPDAAGAGTGGAAAAAPAPAAPALPQLSTGRETFASVLDSVRTMAGAIPLDGTIPVVVPPPLTPADENVPPEDPSSAGAFELLAAPSVAATSSAVVLRPPGAGKADLLALGVPQALLTRAGSGPVPLSDLLRDVPSPPDLIRSPGAVVGVVGDGATVLLTARQMAARLGQAETDVVLAGALEAQAGYGRRLPTSAAAQRFRERRSPSDVVTVVAIGVGPDPADRARGAEVLGSLRPDQTWAVVDARSKPRDCVSWLADVGREHPIDALAATGVLITHEPGTVLGLGIPVGWIDGLPATRVTWAAALSAHLSEDARWD